MSDNANSAQITKNIQRASYLLMGSVMLSRVIGFIREWVLARTMGATALTDVYYASFTIPDFINHLMAAGALSISFVPMLAGYHAAGRDEFGKRVFRCLSTVMGLALIVVILIAEIFAPQLSEWVAPGFQGEQKALLVTLLRIILPAQLFFYWGGLAISVQHTHGRFFLPAIAPIVYNTGIILGGVLLHKYYGIMGFSVGVVVGCIFSHGIFQWWGVRKLGYSIAPLFDFSDEMRGALKRYVWLTLPIMFSFSLVVADEWLSKYFASSLAERTVSWLSYARTEMRIPVAIIGQAAGIASFPYLARLWSKGAYSDYAHTLTRELMKLWCLAPLATLLLVNHALPITHFIYGGGRFTPQDLESTASAVRLMGIGVFFWTAQVLLARGFYACQITWLPSILGTVLTALCLPLYAFLSAKFGFEGLALAGSIGILVYTVLLCILLRRHLKSKCPTYSLKNFYVFCLSWGLFLIPLWGISEGIKGLGLYRSTQLSGLVEVLVAIAATASLAFLAQRTVFKKLTGTPLY